MPVVATESFGGPCSVNLDQVTCSDAIFGSRKKCFNDSDLCETDCSCSCRDSFVNYGRTGVIDVHGAQVGRWAWDVFLVTGP